MKKLKLSGRVFLTSDPHVGHGNIIKYCNRPFLAEADRQALAAGGGVWHRGNWKGDGSSRYRISDEGVEMMNDAFFDNTNRLVGRDDTLIMCGDWCFAPPRDYQRAAEAYRNRLNCRNVHYVRGNHDHDIDHLFSTASDILQVVIKGKLVVCCHYAMLTWPDSHRSSYHAYGHSHSTIEAWCDKFMPGRRSLDVGVDNALKLLGEFRPFSFEEFDDILGRRTGFSMNPDTPTDSREKREEEVA